MAQNYFKNLQVVGANIDEGISKLETAWKIPNLLLNKSIKKDIPEVKSILTDLRNEIKHLREALDAEREKISHLREINEQFLDEQRQTYRDLKEEVNEIKILFSENGYEDNTEPNGQCDALSTRGDNSDVINSLENISLLQLSNSYLSDN